MTKTQCLGCSADGYSRGKLAWQRSAHTGMLKDEAVAWLNHYQPAILKSQ